MATPNPPGPDPLNSVISVATSEVDEATGASYRTESFGSADPVAPAPASTGVNGPDGTPIGDDPSSPVPAAHEGGETDVWMARYAFGNFAARIGAGLFVVAVTLFALYRAYDTGAAHWRVLTILLGTTSTAFWLWLGFRIIKARLSHHYHLTTKRLFVTSGLIRHQREMMELEHLKEVSIRQERLLDHLFKVGTVVVESNVQGAPLLYLLGIHNPQTVVDQIYHHARG